MAAKQKADKGGSTRLERFSRMAKGPRGDSYVRLRALGEERLSQVESMLVSNDKTAKDVADIIQGEWGELQDVRAETLQKQLQRYRARFLDRHLVIAAKEADLNPDSRRIVLKNLADDIDVLNELQELAEVQKERLKKVLEKERQMPLLFSWMHKEIGTMVKLYEQISELQFDLGVRVRAPREIKASLGFEASPALQRALEQKQLNAQVMESTRQALRVLDGVYTVEAP